MSESYNEAWRESDEVKVFKTFLDNNKNVGNHFNRCFKSESGDQIYFSVNKDDIGDTVSDMHEMHRKSLSQVIFNYWVREELLNRKIIGKFLFGPYYLNKSEKIMVTYRESLEIFLETVDSLRIDETYEHHKCSGENFKSLC